MESVISKATGRYEGLKTVGGSSELNEVDHY